MSEHYESRTKRPGGDWCEWWENDYVSDAVATILEGVDSPVVTIEWEDGLAAQWRKVEDVDSLGTEAQRNLDSALDRDVRD